MSDFVTRSKPQGRVSMSRIAAILILFLSAVTSGAAETVVSSPNGKVRFTVQTHVGGLQYGITFRGRPLVEPSPIVMTIEGVDQCAGAAVGPVERYCVDQTYPARGVHSKAIDRANGARISLKAPGGSAMTLDVRAYDDGAAFRFVIPGNGSPRTPDEATVLRLPARSTVWYHGLRGHYEDTHQSADVAEVPEGAWAAPPLTFKLPGAAGYGSITESALTNYAGMALQADGKRGFVVRLGHSHPASYPFELRYGVEEAKRLSKSAALDGTITTPWRVVMVGADLNALVNCDIISSLAPPPDAKLFPKGLATEWVRPGRAVWEYLDGKKSTLEEMKEYSRMAGDLGFEHNVLEGFWRRWTDDQIRELVDYSRQKKVGIWLWVHSKDIRNPANRASLFRRFNGLGVAGVKVDFLDHEAKEVIDLYEAILRDAAANRLLVNFHGSNKPTGEWRTWPNELTREAVRGMESSRLRDRARHDVILPFTRMLAGPADYTPVHFGDRRSDTTWAHQVASAAILTSPLLTYGANPRTILANPAVEMMKSIPATWDETIVLPASEIGEVAAFARRKGDTWFLAIMNGTTARSVRVPLLFLGSGSYGSLVVRDRSGESAAVETETKTHEREDMLSVELNAGGGFVARFTRERAQPAER
jgi:alpha-glucosidase